MAWSTLAPTCGTPPRRAGIIAVPAGATLFAIAVDAPVPPYPYFLTPNWNTGFFGVVATAIAIGGEMGTPAPSDGSGTISWLWEDPNG
jgi:hypothetical protein